MDTFNPPFKIGEVYWRPHATPTPIDVPCPACFGSCWLTVILGDGEDAEREGQAECPTELRTGPLCDNPDHYDGMHSGFHGPCVKPTPAPTLPPLDPALVEECVGVALDDVAPWFPFAKLPRDAVISALTHYRTRVEGPLREELWQARETSKKWLDGLESAERNVAHFRAEADRLRGELNQYDERGHEAKLEIDRLRGELKAITADRDGWQAACNRSREECGRLRGELAKQVEANRLLAAERDAHSKMRRQWQEVAESGVNPQPTDEERRKAAEYVRDRAARGNAMGVTIAERIATILEQPPRRRARTSLGRRFVLRFEDGEISTRTHYDLHSAEVCASAAGAEIIACDLVPVAEEEKP